MTVRLSVDGAAAADKTIAAINSRAGLAGAITAQPNPVYQGNNETLTFSITNTGNEDITNLNAQVVIVDPDTQEIRNTFESIIDVAMSATVSGQFVSSTSNLAGKTYLAVLQASTSAMTQQKRLASATFTVNVPLATLKGLMSAGSKPVCLGKDEVLSYSVTNAGHNGYFQRERCRACY